MRHRIAMNIPPKPTGQPAALHPIVAGQASKAAAPAGGGLHAPQAGPSTPHKTGSPGSSSSKAPGQLQSLNKALKPLALRYRGDTRDPFEAGVFKEGLTAKGRGQDLLNHVIAKVPNEHDENKLKRLSAFVATSTDPAVSTSFALRGSDTGYLYQIRYHGQGEDLPKYLNERHAAVAASVDECKEELKRLHQESLKLLGPFTHLDQLPDALKGKAGLLQLRVQQAKDRYETKSALLSEIKRAKGFAADEAETPIKDKIDPQDIVGIQLVRPAPVKGEALLTPIYQAPSKSVVHRTEPEPPASAARAGTVPPNFSPRKPS
mgnify:CR=1 FL=1